MPVLVPAEPGYLRVGWVPRGLPFVNGDRLDQPTFHRLYQETPSGVKAELIGGLVYVASPVSVHHSRPHGRIVQWLSAYADDTAGTEALDDASTILGADSEPQPDACLRVLEGNGGQSVVNPKGYVEGPAELVAEVAYSTANIDLHAKRLDYESAGVKEYVVVLVGSRQVFWFTRGRKGFAEHKPGEDGILRSKVFPGLWLDPAAVFDLNGRRILAVLRQGLASLEHAAFVAKLEARFAKRKPRPNP